MKLLIYWKWKVWNAVKKLADKVWYENNIVDDKSWWLNLTKKDLENFDYIVVSPWIKPSHHIYKIWKNKIIWELDFIDKLIKDKKLNNIFFIWITGTDWKSTTTYRTFYILDKILPKNKYKVWIWWNFDKPVSEIVLEILNTDDFNLSHIIVTEVSSFMSYNLKKLKFVWSFWTNFAVDHLDWHKDINDYWDAKLNLFKNTDFVKYPNIEDENNYKFFKTDLNDFVKFLKEILEYFRINLDYDAIIETINQIPSLPHRFQLIKQIDQTKIYDDWKCTTANCQAYALSQIKWKCILIAGWFDKWIDYSVNSKLYKQKVAFWIFFGNIANKLADLFNKLKIDNIILNDFDKIVETALKVAKQKRIENILFSPWASSFDMFNNRKERAEKFLKVLEKY